MRNPEKTEPGPPVDYVERVNRAIDHVVRNLASPLRLEDVAAAACFSPFHFHRVFRAVVGETLNQFKKRVRLERAMYLMTHAPGRSLTEIALDCGFSSSSDFSRSFKQRYGVPPSAFDLSVWRASKRDDLEALIVDDQGRPVLRRLAPGENPDGFEAELVDLPPRRVAYLRVLDPYHDHGGVATAVERLLAWADARGLGDNRWYGYMWEDPEIVALEDCRYDVAVEIGDAPVGGPGGAGGGDVGTYEFPAMRVAQVEVKGPIDLEQRAIDWLFGTWLPRSGLVPDEQPCFEAWIGRPLAHGMEHFELFAQLPVRSSG